MEKERRERHGEKNCSRRWIYFLSSDPTLPWTNGFQLHTHPAGRWRRRPHHLTFKDSCGHAGAGGRWASVAQTWSRRCASHSWGPGGTAHRRSSVCIPRTRANVLRLKTREIAGYRRNWHPRLYGAIRIESMAVLWRRVIFADMGLHVTAISVLNSPSMQILTEAPDSKQTAQNKCFFILDNIQQAHQQISYLYQIITFRKIEQACCCYIQIIS